MAVVEASAPTTLGFRAMGSDIVVVVDGPDRLLSQAHRRIDDLEHSWSRFVPDSDISRMNHATDWVDVSPDTLMLIERAVSAWRITGGAFDPTILPSLVANGYSESRSESPGRTVLTSPVHRGPAPGLKGIEIDRTMSRIRLPEGVWFDPGGIGKGLAADLVADELIASGATATVVSAGGDVRVAGRAPTEWVIDVENPFDPEQIVAELALADGAVCTSSVRAKTWVVGDTPMHHLIDPRTGDPMTSRTVSATVVAGEAWMAEALCKAAVIGDPLNALEFVEAVGADGLLVDVDGLVWRTPGMKKFTA